MGYSPEGSQRVTHLLQLTQRVHGHTCTYTHTPSRVRGTIVINPVFTWKADLGGRLSLLPEVTQLESLDQGLATSWQAPDPGSPTVHVAFPQEGTARALGLGTQFAGSNSGPDMGSEGPGCPAITCKSVGRSFRRWSSTFTGLRRTWDTQRDLETPLKYSYPFQMGTLRHRGGKGRAQGSPRELVAQPVRGVGRPVPTQGYFHDATLPASHVEWVKGSGWAEASSPRGWIPHQPTMVRPCWQ